MAAAVRCAPGAGVNLGQAALLPLDLWQDLLWEGGFMPLPGEEGPAGMQDAPAEDWAASHWRRLDPYRDGGSPEARFFVLERRAGEDPPAGRLAAACRRTLGPHHQQWPAPESRLDADWVFLIGHVQDVSAYVPFWSVLPKDRVRVILRRSADRVFPPPLAAALQAWMETRGIDYAAVAKTGDWDWTPHSGRPRVFLAHSESNIGLSHALNAAFSATARYHGYITAVMQHGIWLEEFAQPAAFASSRLLAWAKQHAEFLRQPGSSRIAGFPAPRGLLAGTQEVITGAPKFDQYASAAASGPARLLGAWAARYQRVVVCTTNLQWTKHAAPKGAVRSGIAALAARFPRWLFLVKPHPTEPLGPEAFEGRPENLVVLDELACWWTGLTTAGLIQAADVVLSTVSTTVLEAALAGKPCIVLDTGNPVRYEDVRLTPLGEVAAALAAQPARCDYGPGFAARYYDLDYLGRSLAAAFSCLEAAANDQRVPAPAEMRSICMEQALGSQLTWFAEEFGRRIEPEQWPP
jgi:hypothetical protein